MTLEQELARGHQAKRILEDPLFKESVEKVQADVMEKFACVDPSDLQGLQIQRLRLKALADVVRELQEVLETGKLAGAEIQRKQTIFERSQEVVKRGLRAVF